MNGFWPSGVGKPRKNPCRTIDLRSLIGWWTVESDPTANIKLSVINVGRNAGEFIAAEEITDPERGALSRKFIGYQ